MYFYHGYALGVASSVDGQEFTEASCALSVGGGKATATQSTNPLPAGIKFKITKSSISGWDRPSPGLPAWITAGSVVIEDLDIQGKFTAKRIVANIYAEDTGGSYEGGVVITGSEFIDVKIAGTSVTIETSPDLSTQYPTYDRMQAAFANSFSRGGVLGCLVGRGLPAPAPTASPDLRAAYDGYQEQMALPNLKPFVVSSFVTKVSGLSGGITACGPVISVPGFGNIYLGELLIWDWMRCLTMFRIVLDSGYTISGASTGYGGTPFP